MTFTTGNQDISANDKITFEIHCKKYIKILSDMNQREKVLVDHFYPRHKNYGVKKVRQLIYQFKALQNQTADSLMFYAETFNNMAGVQVKTNPSLPPDTTAIGTRFPSYFSEWIKIQGSGLLTSDEIEEVSNR